MKMLRSSLHQEFIVRRPHIGQGLLPLRNGLGQRQESEVGGLNAINAPKC